MGSATSININRNVEEEGETTTLMPGTSLQSNNNNTDNNNNNSSGYDPDNHYNYPSLVRQRVAVGGLVATNLLRCASYHTFATWIPYLLSLYWVMFTVPSDYNESTGKLLMSFPVACELLQSFGGVVVGLITDACIKKTKMLLVGISIMFIGQCLLAADVFYISTQIHCTMSSFTNVSLPDCYTDQLYNPDDYLAGFYLYLILSLILTVGNAILRTVLPALAGDQLRSRDGVNKLYILYYWFWKLGDSVSVIFCLLITYYGHKELQENPPVTLIPHLFQQKFVDQTRSFATFAVVMFSLAVITLLSVICTRVTRQPQANIGVITDTAGIWKQAVQRKIREKRDTSCLSLAMHKYGGDYPENAVREKANLGRYFLVVLTFVPVTFTYWLPRTNMAYNYTAIEPKNISSTVIYEGENLEAIHFMVLCEVCLKMVPLFCIPLIYGVSRFLYKKCGFEGSLVHRIIVGLLFTAAANAISLCYYKAIEDDENLHNGKHLVQNSLDMISNVLQGMSTALIFTSGFELAITAAPRSMQATAMGILFIPDGVASIVRYEIITRSPHIGYINAYFIAGITGSIGSAVLLLVIHKKWNWHLISGRSYRTMPVLT